MKLDVVYISDDNFASKLGVSLISLIETNRDLELHIHLIDMGIQEKNITKIMSICQESGVHCCTYKTDAALYERLEKKELHIPVENNSVATLGRLFLNEILPDDITRVLYLDCDIIVRSSLFELVSMKLESSLAVVKDINYKFFRNRREVQSMHHYFNAGVLLINLPKYKNKINAVDIAGLLDQDLLFADQDVLNIIFENDYKILTPKYNSSVRIRMVKPAALLYWIAEDEKSLYTIEELEEAHSNPILIHYTSSLLGRPWELNCEDPDIGLWREIYMSSPWKGLNLNSKNLSLSNRLGRLLYKIFPEKIYCHIDYTFARTKFEKSGI